MPLVEESIDVIGTKDEIFSIIENFADYPKYMEGVSSVEIIEKNEDSSVSKWVTSVDGREIIWTERDVIDRESYRIEFDKVEGDLKVFNGFWQVADSDTGANVRSITFSIYFEFGIPMLSALLHPLLAKKLRENMKMMLEAIKVRVEG